MQLLLPFSVLLYQHSQNKHPLTSQTCAGQSSFTSECCRGVSKLDDCEEEVYSVTEACGPVQFNLYSTDLQQQLSQDAFNCNEKKLHFRKKQIT